MSLKEMSNSEFFAKYGSKNPLTALNSPLCDEAFRRLEATEARLKSEIDLGQAYRKQWLDAEAKLKVVSEQANYLIEAVERQGTNSVSVYGSIEHLKDALKQS